MRYLYILLIFNLFFFGCDDDEGTSGSGSTTGGDSETSVEEYFSHNISNQSAFYFFNTVLINNESIDSTDWVAAFNGDICVGAQQWTCEGSCEVPIYGEYSLNDDTEGYMLPGEFPSFKIYDTSEDIFYDATPSTQIPWQDGITPVIDSLIVQ